jgi:hypothetical protein
LQSHPLQFFGNCLDNLHAFFLPKAPFFISCLGGILRFRLTIFGVIALFGIFDILMIKSSRKIFKYALLSFLEWFMGWFGFRNSPDSEAPGHDHEEGREGGAEIVGFALGSAARNVAEQREGRQELPPPQRGEGEHAEGACIRAKRKRF